MSEQSQFNVSGQNGSSAPFVAENGPTAIAPCIYWKLAAVCCALAVAVWAVFGQTIRYEFINYDDDSCVYENPVVTRGLDLHEIAWTFTHNSGRDSWFPLVDISHMLDWQFYGPNAGGHHLTNVLLHAATAIFLFLALQAMTGAMWRSAFVAAIFAIHPLRVQSVAWVAERKDVLSGLFFMLSLWTWIRYAQKKPATEKPGSNLVTAIQAVDPRSWTLDYYLALIFFILGLLSKSMVVALPFVLLLLDYWPLKRLLPSLSGPSGIRFHVWRELLLEKWPFFLLCAAGCVLTLLTQPHVVLAVRHLTFSWRLGNSLMAYVDYLWHMVYPAGLALLYSHPEQHLPVWRLVLSVAVLLGISAFVLAGRRKHPYLLVGWLWYLGMFLPVIDIMQTGDQTRADRYTYLPQIGLYVLVTWGFVELCAPWRHRRVILVSIAAVVLTALSADAYIQTTYWKNSISVWTHTLACTPNSYIANCNLGIALADQGNVNQAIQNFNRALQLNPNDAKSINNLGKVLMTQGKLDQAIQDFNRALQIQPNDVKTLDNLGVALAAQAKPDIAIQDLDRALQIEPQFADTYFNLGNVFMARADFDDAAQNYQQALQINPDFADAHCNLGLVLARQGNLDEAVQHYEQAIQLKSHYADALNDLAGVLAAQDKLDTAAQYYGQLLQFKPNDPNVLNNLGVVLARQGKLDDAIQDFDRALQLNPDDASTHNNLGIALASQGKLDEAISHFQQALYLARAQANFTLEESIRARLNRYQSPSPQPQAP